ncbi:hypothetical protein SRHO_G00154660 [Serrasalmus rhombeus]
MKWRRRKILFRSAFQALVRIQNSSPSKDSSLPFPGFCFPCCLKTGGAAPIKPISASTELLEEQELQGVRNV